MKLFYLFPLLVLLGCTTTGNSKSCEEIDAYILETQSFFAEVGKGKLLLTRISEGGTCKLLIQGTMNSQEERKLFGTIMNHPVFQQRGNFQVVWDLTIGEVPR